VTRVYKRTEGKSRAQKCRNRKERQTDPNVIPGLVRKRDDSCEYIRRNEQTKEQTSRRTNEGTNKQTYE
jgi:hypothetical protein